MYSINSNNVSDVKESFVNLRRNRTKQQEKQKKKSNKNKTQSFKCNDTKNIITQTMMINDTNYLKNVNTDCLIVPSKVFDGGKKKNFILSFTKNDCKDLKCSKSSDHAFQIFPINLLNNTIFIDTIIPAFFSIVNTKNMISGGIIKLLNTSSKINLIQIDNLDNNDDTTTELDLDGNICHDPDDLENNFKFSNFTQDIKIQKTSIDYDGNPIIYFFGDYTACSLAKKNQVNNLFVYLDYGDKEQLTTCLNKMKFNIVKSANNTKNFKIPFIFHGSQYNDYTARNFIISFDPRDISTRDGFITIINTKNNIEGFYQDESNDDKINNLFSDYMTAADSLSEAFVKKTPDDINIIKKIDLTKFKNETGELSDSNINKYIEENSFTDMNFDKYIQELNEYLKSNVDTPVASSDAAPYSSDAAPYSSDAAPYSSDAAAITQTVVPITKTVTSNKKPNTLKGSISFSKDLINSLITSKKSCLYVKFWLTTFNFIDNKLVSVNDRKGPYKQIDFVGNPKIIIYIPPYVKNNKNDINRKNAITSLIQENENICDIYINISY